MNMSNYVGGDPVNRTDPSGLASASDLCGQKGRITIQGNDYEGDIVCVYANPDPDPFGPAPIGGQQSFTDGLNARSTPQAQFLRWFYSAMQREGGDTVVVTGEIYQTEPSERDVCVAQNGAAGAAIGGTVGLGVGAGCAVATEGICAAGIGVATEAGFWLGGAIGSGWGLLTCPSAKTRVGRPSPEKPFDACMRAARGDASEWVSFCGSLPSWMQNNVAGGQSARNACLAHQFSSVTQREGWCRNQFGK